MKRRIQGAGFSFLSRLGIAADRLLKKKCHSHILFNTAQHCLVDVGPELEPFFIRELFYIFKKIHVDIVL